MLGVLTGIDSAHGDDPATDESPPPRSLKIPAKYKIGDVGERIREIQATLNTKLTEGNRIIALPPGSRVFTDPCPARQGPSGGEGSMTTRSLANMCLVLLLGAVLAGCGGSSPAGPTSSLPAFERLAIAQQVVWTALGGLAPGILASRSSDEVPLGNLSCQQACDGSACVVTCPVNESFDCPGGGSATDTGTVVGTLTPSLTGQATFQAQQTYTNCRNTSGVTLNGAPGTTAAGTVTFADGQLAGQQTVSLGGAVDYQSSEGSGQCAVDLQVTFTAGTLTGSASGTACGEPVNVGF